MRTIIVNMSKTRALGCFGLTFVLLNVGIVSVNCDSEWESEDGRQDWIDPHSIGILETNLDQSEPDTKIQDNARSCEKPDVDCSPIENELKLCKRKTEKLLKNLEEEQERARPDARSLTAKEQPFFRQYLRYTLNQFRNFDQDADRGHYEVDIWLSQHSYEYLVDYLAEKNVSIQEVHTILSQMMKNVRWIDDENDFGSPQESAFLFYLDVVAKVSVIMVAALTAVWILSRISISLVRFLVMTAVVGLVMSFFVSIPWTWWHLYQKKIAERMAEVNKGLPKECTHRVTSIWSTLKAALFSPTEDECTKYFERLHINPLWEVPPTQAVVVTFVRFFLEPAGHIGRALRELLMSAFDGLPLAHWLPMYFLIILLVVLVIFCSCGYRISSPLMRIEPTHHLRAVDGNSTLQAQVQQLQQVNKELQQRLQRPRTVGNDGRGDGSWNGVEAVEDIPSRRGGERGVDEDDALNSRRRENYERTGFGCSSASNRPSATQQRGTDAEKTAAVAVETVAAARDKMGASEKSRRRPNDKGSLENVPKTGELQSATSKSPATTSLDKNKASNEEEDETPNGDDRHKSDTTSKTKKKKVPTATLR